MSRKTGQALECYTRFIQLTKDGDREYYHGSPEYGVELWRDAFSALTNMYFIMESDPPNTSIGWAALKVAGV